MTNHPSDSDRLAGGEGHARGVLADPLLRRASALGAAYLTCYLAATLLLPETSLQAKLVVDIVYLVPETAAVVALSLAARRSVRARWFWAVGALATATTLVGDLNWALYDLVLGRPPSPSAGDIAYTTAPLILLGWLVVACRRMRPRLRDVLDLSVPFTAVIFGVYLLVIAPQLDHGLSAATIPSVTESVAYVVVALIATWILAGYRSIPIAVHLFYASIVVGAVSYPLYAYAASAGSWHVNWIYTGWQISFVLAALAGATVVRLGEPERPPVKVTSDVNAWLLSGGLALTLAVIAWESRDGRVHPAAVVIGIVTALIVTARFHHLVHQRGRLADDLARSLAAQRRLAIIDPLTDIPNRLAFSHALRTIIDSCSDTRERVGLLVIDLDHFRRVNDGYGHPVGDELLRLVAQRLRGAIRADDSLARVGGEEFALIVPRVNDATLVDLAERCRRRIVGEPFHIADHDLRVTVSVGVATYPDDTVDADTLIRMAYRALRQAKQAGGDRTHAGSEGMHVRHLPVPDTSAYTMLERLADRLDAEQAEQEHSLAMLDLAGRLADRLRLSTDQRRRCLLAARFHDIGKVGIPQRILTKPGPLTALEWEVMREHVRIGVDLLVDCADTREVAPIVGQHHERPDGRGYPAALTTDEILLEAAIIGAADAWTAMLADRAYRGALTPQQARAQLLAGRGSQFSVAVVDALLSLLDEEDRCAA